MQHHEYRAVPAPSRPERRKGVKSGQELLAHALSDLMNRMASEGWEYLRADTLPCEERKGLLGGRETRHHSLLIFRRALAHAAPEQVPGTSARPGASGPAPVNPPLSSRSAEPPQDDGNDSVIAPPQPKPQPQQQTSAPVLRAAKPGSVAAGPRLFGTTGLGNRRDGAGGNEA